MLQLIKTIFVVDLDFLFDDGHDRRDEVSTSRSTQSFRVRPGKRLDLYFNFILSTESIIFGR